MHAYAGVVFACRRYLFPAFTILIRSDPHDRISGRLLALHPFWLEWMLDAPLGEGSYGKVYRIYHEILGERYYAALK